MTTALAWTSATVTSRIHKAAQNTMQLHYINRVVIKVTAYLTKRLSNHMYCCRDFKQEGNQHSRCSKRLLSIFTLDINPYYYYRYLLLETRIFHVVIGKLICRVFQQGGLICGVLQQSRIICGVLQQGRIILRVLQQGTI